MGKAKGVAVIKGANLLFFFYFLFFRGGALVEVVIFMSSDRSLAIFAMYIFMKEAAPLV